MKGRPEGWTRATRGATLLLSLGLLLGCLGGVAEALAMEQGACAMANAECYRSPGSADGLGVPLPSGLVPIAPTGPCAFVSAPTALPGPRAAVTQPRASRAPPLA